MSNSVSISDDFIDIVTLQNYMLVAFPNFLIISIDNPTYNNKTKKLVLGATRGLEVERRTRNWAIRVQFPPGAK
jgi:hypothetical protein